MYSITSIQLVLPSPILVDGQGHQPEQHCHGLSCQQHYLDHQLVYYRYVAQQKKLLFTYTHYFLQSELTRIALPRFYSSREKNCAHSILLRLNSLRQQIVMFILSSKYFVYTCTQIKNCFTYTLHSWSPLRPIVIIILDLVLRAFQLKCNVSLLCVN